MPRGPRFNSHVDNLYALLTLSLSLSFCQSLFLKFLAHFEFVLFCFYAKMSQHSWRTRVASANN